MVEPWLIGYVDVQLLDAACQISCSVIPRVGLLINSDEITSGLQELCTEQVRQGAGRQRGQWCRRLPQ